MIWMGQMNPEPGIEVLRNAPVNAGPLSRGDAQSIAERRPNASNAQYRGVQPQLAGNARNGFERRVPL